VRELVGGFDQVLLDVFDRHFLDEFEILGHFEGLLNAKVGREEKYVSEHGQILKGFFVGDQVLEDVLFAFV
jgi:hypothetical protein